MRISCASDLHLEFGDVELISEPADVLVLAGDICTVATWKSSYLNFFLKCADQFENVIYISGNHEYYLSEFSNVQKFLKEKLDNLLNVHFLENETLTIQGITFVCSTLWTDCNNNDPEIKDLLKRKMSDFGVIKFNPVRTFHPMDSVILHNTARDFIERHIPEQKTVIVTHHLPSFKSNHPRFKNDPINFGFASNLENIMINNPQIKLWIHGHTHDPFDYKIGETRVVCNPRGYYGEETLFKTFKTKIIKV